MPYRMLVYRHLKDCQLSILNYCITFNHTHFLVAPKAGAGEEVLSRFMQRVEGEFAQAYNLAKGRRGAFWEDRYHATMIDAEGYLWNCLKYIDLNMVRAGVVKHPSDWAWTGFCELVGTKNRYRLVDLSRLLELLGGWPQAQFRMAYRDAIQEAIKRRDLQRQGKWSECIAVGGEAFIKRVGRQIRNRMKIEIEEDPADSTTLLIREAQSSYSPKTHPKNCPQAAKTTDYRL